MLTASWAAAKTASSLCVRSKMEHFAIPFSKLYNNVVFVMQITFVFFLLKPETFQSLNHQKVEFINQGCWCFYQLTDLFLEC